VVGQSHAVAALPHLETGPGTHRIASLDPTGEALYPAASRIAIPRS
jgi:hypothetical protein